MPDKQGFAIIERARKNAARKIEKARVDAAKIVAGAQKDRFERTGLAVLDANRNLAGQLQAIVLNTDSGVSVFEPHNEQWTHHRWNTPDAFEYDPFEKRVYWTEAAELPVLPEKLKRFGKSFLNRKDKRSVSKSRFSVTYAPGRPCILAIKISELPGVSFSRNGKKLKTVKGSAANLSLRLEIADRSFDLVAGELRQFVLPRGVKKFSVSLRFAAPGTLRKRYGMPADAELKYAGHLAQEHKFYDIPGMIDYPLQPGPVEDTMRGFRQVVKSARIDGSAEKIHFKLGETRKRIEGDERVRIFRDREYKVVLYRNFRDDTLVRADLKNKQARELPALGRPSIDAINKEGSVRLWLKQGREWKRVGLVYLDDAIHSLNKKVKPFPGGRQYFFESPGRTYRLIPLFDRYFALLERGRVHFLPEHSDMGWSGRSIAAMVYHEFSRRLFLVSGKQLFAVDFRRDAEGRPCAFGVDLGGTPVPLADAKLKPFAKLPADVGRVKSMNLFSLEEAIDFELAAKIQERQDAKEKKEADIARAKVAAAETVRKGREKRQELERTAAQRRAEGRRRAAGITAMAKQKQHHTEGESKRIRNEARAYADRLARDARREESSIIHEARSFKNEKISQAREEKKLALEDEEKARKRREEL